MVNKILLALLEANFVVVVDFVVDIVILVVDVVVIVNAVVVTLFGFTDHIIFSCGQ